MNPKTKDYTFEKFTADQQGSGSFDGGKITEIKPIPFPHERGGSGRVGPLLYWAWASANGDGIIGMHPHKGFEIVSYVLEGAIGHTDTAGNNRRVSAGGAQIMQTGSGISHQEEMYGERTDFFQIWFEPNLREALSKPPVYMDFESNEFQIEKLDTETTLKRIIGPHGAAQLQAPIEWNEVHLSENAIYDLDLEANSFAAMVLVSGDVDAISDSNSESLNARDFALIKTDSERKLTIATGSTEARLALITGPLDPDYPLYQH